MPPVPHLPGRWPDFTDGDRWHKQLGMGRKPVWYDGRGTGMSDRDVADMSLEAMLSDLSAIATASGLAEFAVLNIGLSAIAMTYAVRHPDYATRLVAWPPVPSMAEFLASPALQTLPTIRSTGWPTFTNAVAHIPLGWGHPDEAREFAAWIREVSDPDA